MRNKKRPKLTLSRREEVAQAVSACQVIHCPAVNADQGLFDIIEISRLQSDNEKAESCEFRY